MCSRVAEHAKFSRVGKTTDVGLGLATQGCQQMAAQPARRLIVDAQIHLWKASTPERPWVAGAVPQLPEPFTMERLVPMMDEAGVDRVVIVPPMLKGLRLDYAQEAVKRYPGRFAIMGRIAPNDPQTARRLPTWKEQPGVLGIRLNFAGGQAQVDHRHAQCRHTKVTSHAKRIRKTKGPSAGTHVHDAQPVRTAGSIRLREIREVTKLDCITPD